MTMTTIEVRRESRDDEKFSALAFKLDDRPFVGQLTFIPRLFKRARVRLHRAEPGQGQEERIGRSCCRCTPTIAKDQGSSRATSLPGRPEGRHHRRTLCDPSAR